MAALPRVRSLAVLMTAGLLGVTTACADGPHSVVTNSVPQAAPASGPPSAAAAVTASPAGLRLRGQPWWPSGFNAPQLATDYTVNFGCGAEVDLDWFFRTVPEQSLTRVPMFQALAVNKNTGALDFTAVDEVITVAEKYGRLVLPVLGAQTGDCGDEIFKQRDWYVDGWKKLIPVPGRSVLSYRDWLRTAVSRWRGSPVLAGWELVGEPEPSNCSGTQCDLRLRECPSDAAQVLRAFMDEAGQTVRELDPQRLIFAGYVGGSQCGIAGNDFGYVSASANVDVVEYHDYSDADTPLPGGPNNGLARRLEQARQLGKPLLVAEIGEFAGSCQPLPDRRERLGRRIAGQRAAGSAGALIWAFVPDPRQDRCTYDVGPDDPLWALVAEQTTVG
ncbi:cellulase family glycosylhydrolase [Nocardia inohanensis]|uniref:cellulase family glycosylhydrolase n=1 Tax=Nocardia inohanensis TaxID=209246 RepID=UPI0009FD1EAA|nr:cellulase family glycosylhydrolase [Nocardia inohanensis]